jgi:putative tricarboxylic transport membrane protein
MIALELIGQIFAHVFAPITLLLITASVIYGILFGVIPGLGPPLAVALLIPLSIGLDPITAISMMGAAYISAVYAGSISAILINTPGEPTSTATTFDGYPLTRQGKANEALGASLTASTIGGLLSLLVLVAIAPAMANVAIKFGATEFFALGVFGLVVIAVISRGALLKGGLAAIMGLLLSMVGYSPTMSVPRFAFGNSYLAGGIPLVPVIVGLFAVSEAIMLIIQGGQIAEGTDDKTRVIGSLMVGVRQTISRPYAVLRSSAIGIGFGIIPGIGAAVANFVAYYHMMSFSPESEKFGSGAIDGVIGPEASNNAVTAAALIPTLVLGIPGNVTTTILLGALLFNGIQIGPLLFSETPELAYSFFLAIFVANILMFVFGYFISKRLIRFTRLPVEVIAPAVIIMSILGTFALNFNVLDSILVVSVGAIAVPLRKLGFSPINIVFGLILGPILETNYHRALNLSQGEYSIFFTNSISAVLLALSAIIVASNILPAVNGISLLDRLQSSLQ